MQLLKILNTKSVVVLSNCLMQSNLNVELARPFLSKVK